MRKSVVFILISLVCISSGVYAVDMRIISRSWQDPKKVDLIRLALTPAHNAVWQALIRENQVAFEEAIEAGFSPLILKKDSLRDLHTMGSGGESFLVQIYSAPPGIQAYFYATLSERTEEKTRKFCVRQLHESLVADDAKRARRVLDHFFTVATGVYTFKFDAVALDAAFRGAVVVPGGAVEKMLRDVGLERYCPAATS